MNAPRTHRAKKWFCIELVDEQEGMHSILSTYTDEDSATALLAEADIRLPPGAHIYYWEAGKRPVAAPPAGYAEGPMTRPGGPIDH